MDIDRFVSYETAKLLKEKGFNEWCDYMYTTSIRHNGAPISFEEELDLKEDGLEGEIEYIPGGNIEKWTNRNEDIETLETYSCPKIDDVLYWLRKKYNVHVETQAFPHEDNRFYWSYTLYELRHIKGSVDGYYRVDGGWKAGFDSYEKACEDAINRYIKNHINN